jgi:hypothetical protein
MGTQALDKIENRSTREHAFLALFTLSLSWAFLQAGALLVLSAGGGEMNLGQEGSLVRKAAEDWGPPAVAAAAAGIVTIFLVRFAPRFLRIPARVTSLRLMGSLVLSAAVVAVILMAVPMAVTTIIDPPGPRADAQHIPMGFWIAPWATLALTPVASILIAWWWVVRKSRSRPRASEET